MRLLPDTHVMLWWLEGDPRLSHTHHALLSDPSNHTHLSAISLAEIAIKATIGKLTADINEVEQTAQAQGFTMLPFTSSHARRLADLPLLHRDPFDRMLISQAQADDLTLLTVDPACRQYDVRSL